MSNTYGIFTPSIDLSNFACEVSGTLSGLLLCIKNALLVCDRISQRVHIAHAFINGQQLPGAGALPIGIESVGFGFAIIIDQNVSGRRVAVKVDLGAGQLLSGGRKSSKCTGIVPGFACSHDSTKPFAQRLLTPKCVHLDLIDLLILVKRDLVLLQTLPVGLHGQVMGFCGLTIRCVLPAILTLLLGFFLSLFLQFFLLLLESLSQCEAKLTKACQHAHGAPLTDRIGRSS